jgi:hypothetical protein
MPNNPLNDEGQGKHEKGGDSMIEKGKMQPYEQPGTRGRISSRLNHEVCLKVENTEYRSLCKRIIHAI